GEPVGELDRLHVRYTGWLDDTTVFDSNRSDNRDAFIFAYPPGNRAIVGWGVGIEGDSVGATRKLVIPEQRGYGERGTPRAGIGPDEPLYFELEVVHIDRYTPPEGEPAAEGQPAPAGQDGSGGGAGQD